MNEKFKEHFLNTKNVGKIKKADMEGKWKSGFCGDTISVTATIKNGVFTDVKHQCCGCWALIGSASMYTDYLKGKTVAEIYELSEDQYRSFIGPIEEEKQNCIIGPYIAVKEALKKSKE